MVVPRELLPCLPTAPVTWYADRVWQCAPTVEHCSTGEKARRWEGQAGPQRPRQPKRHIRRTSKEYGRRRNSIGWGEKWGKRGSPSREIPRASQVFGDEPNRARQPSSPACFTSRSSPWGRIPAAAAPTGTGTMTAACVHSGQERGNRGRGCGEGWEGAMAGESSRGCPTRKRGGQPCCGAAGAGS